jgi:hypothetical protein
MALGLKTGPRAEKCYFTPANSALNSISRPLVQKINFITKKNKSKNQVGKSNSQMLLSISFVCVICFTKRFRK